MITNGHSNILKSLMLVCRKIINFVPLKLLLNLIKKLNFYPVNKMYLNKIIFLILTGHVYIL